MRLDEITLKDFRSYGEATIDLTGVPLAAIVGENGAGKSSIADGALFALTGARTRGNLDDWIRDDEEECGASVIFAPTGGQRYKVSRTRSRRHSGKSNAELVREEGGQWVPDCTGATEVDKRIRDLLGADEDLLLMTSFIAQDEAKRFLGLTPGKRLEVLSEILKVDEQYSPVEKHWKAKGDEAKANLMEARGDITRHEEAVATLEIRESELAGEQVLRDLKAGDLAEAEKALTAAREAARAAEKDAAGVDASQDHLSDLKARQGNLRLRKETLAGQIERYDERTSGRADLERELAGRPDIEAALTSLAESERADAETRQARAVLDADLRAVKQAIGETVSLGKPKADELARLKDLAENLNNRVCDIRGADTPTCDRCGQSIADVALAQTLDQLGAELEIAAGQRNALQKEVEHLRDKLAEQKAEAEKIETEISALPELTYDLAEDRRLKALLERLNEIPAKLAELDGLVERRNHDQTELAETLMALDDPVFLADLAASEQAVAGAEKKAEAAQSAQMREGRAEADAKRAAEAVADSDKAIARHEEAIALLSPSRDKLAETQARARELEEEQADADILRKAFSKWGIPSIIIGNVLLALEREVNELMGLYESGMTVRFESTKETRDGSRDSLEIIVDINGASREYNTFSGGEKYRIASCIRLGLALLMSHRAGARIGTLILDEPEGLDESGRQHLVAILAHLSAQFERILLISHHTDLKEAMPSQIIVSRDDDGLSRVEVCA